MKTKRRITITPDIARAIRANPSAFAGFTRMPPSHQHEYLEYILKARKPQTRAKRIATSVTMMAAWHQEKKS